MLKMKALCLNSQTTDFCQDLNRTARFFEFLTVCFIKTKLFLINPSSLISLTCKDLSEKLTTHCQKELKHLNITIVSSNAVCHFDKVNPFVLEVHSAVDIMILSPLEMS